MVSAKGTIFYKDAPVEEAVLTFIPTDGGRSATAKTDSQGTFEMITPGSKRSGCVPGKYKVSIVKQIMIDRHGKPVVITPDMLGENPTVPFPEDITYRQLLPTQYQKAETSGLEIEVKRRGKNQFDFSLNDN